MRTLLCCLLLVAFSGWLGAEDKKDEKIDAKKLVGKWKLKDPIKKEEEKEAHVLGIEFSKDMKVMFKSKVGGTESDLETFYPYKFDADKRKVTSEAGDFTVDKLTDEELVVTFDITFIKRSYSRVKDKKGK